MRSTSFPSSTSVLLLGVFLLGDAGAYVSGQRPPGPASSKQQLAMAENFRDSIREGLVNEVMNELDNFSIFTLKRISKYKKKEPASRYVYPSNTQH